VDVIGMTNATEAKLAREAELCYATIALSTDYDCWHQAEEDVSVEAILEILQRNAETAKDMVRETVASHGTERRCPCADALEDALITARDRIDPDTRERLDVLVKRVLDQ
jgi:5'-methylthioadenosine phosphorylase